MLKDLRLHTDALLMERGWRGSGDSRQVVQEGMGMFPFFPQLDRDGQLRAKEKQVAERRGKNSRRKQHRGQDIKAPRAQPCPSKMQAVCSPVLCVAGRAEAYTEQNVSSSPSHPAHEVLLFLSTCPGSHLGTAHITSSASLPSTDLCCCLL